MSENLSKRPDLLIVSDTAVYINDKGEYLAFEPVAREIEHFAFMFNSITWIAARFTYNPSIRTIKKIDSIPIKYILTPAVGGKGFVNRLKIIKEYFRLCFLILINIYKADVIHSRGPSHAAIITGFLSFFAGRKIFWQKYAGNWNREIDPLSYKINKYLLRKAKKTKVTINGRWPNQPSHILSFENPCITEEERQKGAVTLRNKSYNEKLNFIFVGRVEEAKGTGRILEAFREFKNEKRIGKIRIVGDGPARRIYVQQAKEYGLDVQFLGSMTRNELNELLTDSHVLLLPSSASEGFPKVVAEGANFGCIPVVSAVSSIPQYINDGFNGFIMPSIDAEGLISCISKLKNLDENMLKKIAMNAYETAGLFTYERYINRIREEILRIHI